MDKGFYDQFKSAVIRTKSANAALNQANLMIYSGDPSFNKIAIKVIPKIGKKIEEITEEDVFNNFDVSIMAENDFFTAQFALIFKNYHRLFEENNVNKYYLSQDLLLHLKFYLKRNL